MADNGRVLLDVLMRRRGEWITDCVWCGIPVVNLRLVPKDYLVRVLNKDKAMLLINKHTFPTKIATADHYLERCYGGASSLSNILPSCLKCNNSRSIGREWRRPKICVDCGSAINGNARRRCKKCLRVMELLAFNPS